MSEIREDGSEVFHYDNPDFPVFVRNNYIPAGFILSPYTPMHYHDEVELVYISGGMIHHRINSDTVTLNTGDVLFINSRQFHELFTDDEEDCYLYCLIFNPDILANCLVMDKMVKAISANENLEYIHLKEESEFRRKITDLIISVYEKAVADRFAETMSDVFLLWNTLYDNLDIEKDNDKRINVGQRMVKEMINYIQHNYKEAITLDDICHAGNVGKTKCTELFSKYVRMTPVEYLRNHRIDKAAELLRDTDMTVSEIAYELGFSGASYFSEIFRERVLMTPSSYRKKMINDAIEIAREREEADKRHNREN